MQLCIFARYRWGTLAHDLTAASTASIVMNAESGNCFHSDIDADDDKDLTVQKMTEKGDDDFRSRNIRITTMLFA
jgi:hypothetical protein